MLLGAASVLALSIAGTALDYAADASGNADTAKMPQAVETRPAIADSLRTDSIRWAQTELRTRGLYKGSLDGILGPETRRAIDLFQKNNGLDRTAALDAQTWEALTGEGAIGQGSSLPPENEGAGARANSSGKTDLGR